jgi:hypothetical protein
MARGASSSLLLGHGETRSGLRLRSAGVWLVMGMCLLVHGCSGNLAVAPDHIELLTLSGHIYEQETSAAGEPGLVQVLITVQTTDGPARTAVSNGSGFYTVSVGAGAISITAEKAGYVTGTSNFYMSTSTVLNFSLILG